MMKKTVFVVMTMALLPAYLFAVDGVVLINQSTVVAAGGFPYVISQPGSYKLTGNLTMNTTPSGNSAGSIDIAVAIGANGVVLDLNGFSIIVTNANSSINHAFYAIADLAAYRQIVIRNGTISVYTTGMGDISLGVGISLRGASYSVFEDLRLGRNEPFSLGSTSMRAGPAALIRRNVFEGNLELTCSSTPGTIFPETLIVENVLSGHTIGAQCKYINNNE